MMSAAYRETAMNLLEQDIGILRLESSKCERGKRDECPLGQREWLLALCWVSSMLGRLELTAKRHVFNKCGWRRRLLWLAHMHTDPPADKRVLEGEPLERNLR